MKKILQTLLIFCAVITTAFAQEHTVIGTVTSSEDNLPIAGAVVRVKDGSATTTTDVNGKFSIKVPSNGKSLVISYSGFGTKEIKLDGATVNVALALNSEILDELTIYGAYGTKQTTRSAVANNQSISGEKLNVIRATNLNNALAGKVAGIQVRSQSAAALGRNTNLRIRGASGFSTGNNPIYVVDGTILPNADDINLDDIEDVSVLQAPSAVALLGPQALDGAILITTKKGKKSDGAGVFLNLGATIDNVYLLPSYQNEYAGGSSADLIKYSWQSTDPVEWKALDGKYYHNYSDDVSWGPRMVGQEYIPWYAWYGGTKYSYKTALLTPQPNNIKDYYQTSIVLNNTVSYRTGGDRYNFALSYGDQYTKGVSPRTSLKKNTLNLNATYDISKKLTLNANVNYIKTILKGEINDSYNNQNTGLFNQWFHRDLDMRIMKELRGLTIPGVDNSMIYASWNHKDPTAFDAADPKGFYAANYWYNPYTYVDLVDKVTRQDRLYGNIALTYKISKDFQLTGTYRKQQNTSYGEDKYSSKLYDSGIQTIDFNERTKGYYASNNAYEIRENYEFLGNYAKKIEDFTVDATVGTDIFKQESKNFNVRTKDGLIVPDLFTVDNSKDTPINDYERFLNKYRAFFARAAFGFKNYLFIESSVRNDLFSTLPIDHNRVTSKSIGASVVFSDLLPKKSFSWLSLGKLRVSWGEVPQSIGTYQYPGSAYKALPLKWNGNLLMTSPQELVDPDIRGAVATRKEIGLDLKFFNYKFGVSATYWDATERNFPTTIPVNPASGFNSILTNIGQINKKGLELQIAAQPLELPSVMWNISATYGNLLDNRVVEISKKYNVTSTFSGAGSIGIGVFHEEGESWGQIYGNGKKRNADGIPLLDANGHFINDPNVSFGSVLPRHTGGLQNSFVIFKDFELNANIDWQIGGKFFSLSSMFGSNSGITARTAAVNDKGFSVRDAVANGGGVKVTGVDATTGLPVEYYVEAKDYYQSLYNSMIYDDYIYDLTFIKLRELSLGYRIPVKKLNKDKWIQSATISLVARNPLLIYAKTKDFDPSEISDTIGEIAQLPGTRGFGFNLKVGF